MTYAILFNLANAYYCVRDYEKAKDIYKNLIANNPKEYRSWFNLAESYISLGQRDKAVECFKMAQPIAQDSPQFGQRIAQFVRQDQSGMPSTQKYA